MQLLKQRLNHHGKNAMLAVLIAATGLPASGALAQFRAEYGGETKSAAEARQGEGDKDTQRTITIASDDKKHKYEVKIVNGELKLAKLDGKELGPERVRITAEAVVFLGEDGEKLHEFRLPAPPAPPAPPAVPDAPRLPGGSAMIEMRDGEGRTFVTRGDIQINRPRVMLGVNMSEPSAALRKQLKLGEEMEVILIERVIDGLPADKAGLEEFDVIVSIDGSEGANASMLTSTLAGKNPDDQLKLVVLRGGEKLRLTAKLAEYDPEKLSGSAGAAPSAGESDHEAFRFEFSGDGEFDMGAYGRGLRDSTRDEILRSLKDSGLNEEQMRIVESRLEESLKMLEEGVREGQSSYLRLVPQVRSYSGTDDGQEGEDQQRELAENLRAKARQAMRDAERQIMEFRDGRLFVRSADEVERRGDELRSRLARAIPDQQEIQSHMSELESRLAELESRLESQMSRFEHRLEEHLEHLADRFERLMDRLEEDRE